MRMSDRCTDSIQCSIKFTHNPLEKEEYLLWLHFSLNLSFVCLLKCFSGGKKGENLKNIIKPVVFLRPFIF